MTCMPLGVAHDLLHLARYFVQEPLYTRQQTASPVSTFFSPVTHSESDSGYIPRLCLGGKGGSIISRQAGVYAR